MVKIVLSVDDSTPVRKMVSFILKGAGYEVIEAADGQEGLEKAQKIKVDMVLTDQNMPRMDGMTLVKNLRAIPHYQNVPIVMLTTEPSEAMKQLGKTVDATDWLVKPFNPAKLLEVTKRLIG